jgi:hypothetical protein
VRMMCHGGLFSTVRTYTHTLETSMTPFFNPPPTILSEAALVVDGQQTVLIHCLIRLPQIPHLITPFSCPCLAVCRRRDARVRNV